jgi:multidrug resistance efflux pump
MLFIFIITVTLLVAFIWANIAMMDDIVKATAFLRPANSISTVKSLVGGELQLKNYIHNEYVNEGFLLFQFDTSADAIELANSEELMLLLNNSILVYDALLITIKQGVNTATHENEEIFLHSEKYILEYNQWLLQIKEVQIKLENENKLPELMIIQVKLDEIERELENIKLRFALWRNNKIIETNETLKLLLQNKNNLERRILDLKRNIKNATIYSPISGIVIEIRKLNIGDNIAPGEEIINIIPVDETKLKVELYIEPSYIPKVKIGQKAILRFPGLPPSKYGKVESIIKLIPADFIYIQTSSPFFVVESEITEPWLFSRDGEIIHLRAGTSASGRIIVGHDTVFRMLMKKIDFID